VAVVEIIVVVGVVVVVVVVGVECVFFLWKLIRSSSFSEEMAF